MARLVPEAIEVLVSSGSSSSSPSESRRLGAVISSTSSQVGAPMLEEMDVCVARLGGRHMRCRKASVGKWPGWPVSGIHRTDRSGERYICWLHDSHAIIRWRHIMRCCIIEYLQLMNLLQLQVLDAVAPTKNRTTNTTRRPASCCL